MANLLDKVIGYVSPKAGAQRAANRRRMEILTSTRGYEAAAAGRLSKHRHFGATSVDGDIGKAGQRVRNRARDSVRNNPLAAKIVKVHADNLVGFGITPRVSTGDANTDKTLTDLFDEWSKVAFAGLNTGFYGGQHLLARMVGQDGEAYVRKRTRRLSDNLPVPLQLQLLDAEYCDWGKGGISQRAPSNVIVQGVEYDAIGNRAGYWILPQNPSSSLPWAFAGNVSNFVPVTDVCHFYEPQNNQVHGISWLAPVLNEIDELKDYELSENIRKKIEACNVGVVIPGDEEESEDPNAGLPETDETPPGSDDGEVPGPTVRDLYGNPFDRMEPGMFAVLHGGKDIRFNSPAVSAGMEAFIRTRHRSIAAGARITYEHLTGDYSQSNFASGKLGLLEFQRFITSFQWHHIIPHLDRIYGWFVEAAILCGKIPEGTKVKVEWVPPEFESITRLDDARADLIEMRIGKRSPQEVISKTGRDPMVVLAEIDAWNQAVDKTSSKVVLDSDPRKVSINGQLQLTASPSNGDDHAGNGQS